MNSLKRNQFPFEKLPSVKTQYVNYCNNRIIIELGKPKPKKNSNLRLLNQGKIYYRKSPSSDQRRPKTTLNGRKSSQGFIKASGTPFLMKNAQNNILNVRDSNSLTGQYSCLNFDSLGNKSILDVSKTQGKQNRNSQLNVNPANSIKEQIGNSKAIKSDRKQSQFSVDSKSEKENIINLTQSQKRIKQIQSIRQERQKLMRLYNPVLQLFKHPIYSEEVVKPKIQPFTKSENVGDQGQNQSIKKREPVKQIVSFFDRAPVIKYVAGCRQYLQKYSQILKEARFKDDQFMKTSLIDNKQIQWIEEEVDATKRCIFPEIIELPKDFINTNQEYKNAPIGLINMVNALLYVNPDIVKNKIQPDNQLFYSMWLFHNKNLGVNQQEISKQLKDIQNCNFIEPIFVDKQLPYDDDMNCPFIIGNNHVWFSVLMKCLAKVFGGYDKLCYLSESDCYKAITGIETRKIRKQLIVSTKDFKEQTTTQMGKGYVILYKRKGVLGILNKISNQTMTIFVPLKGQTNVSIVELFKDKQSDLLMIRSEANWFTNTLTFRTPKQSLYSFYLSCQRQTRVYISTSNAANNIYIYDLIAQNQRKQQMNLRIQSNQNYIDTNLQRGNYKVYLQFGKKHISEYFNSFNALDSKFKKRLKDSPQYKVTLLSCQELILREAGQIRQHGQQITAEKSGFYRVLSSQPTHKKREFVGYANQQF